jgi:hypothetical protein
MSNSVTGVQESDTTEVQWISAARIIKIKTERWRMLWSPSTLWVPLRRTPILDAKAAKIAEVLVTIKNAD